MERSHVLVNLRTYKAELVVELRRVDAALMALATAEDDRANAIDCTVPAAAGSSTYDLLRAFILQQPRFDAQGALEYLVAHGWEAGARGDALNTVRSALAHLAAWGEIVRVRRGVYRIAVTESRKPIPSLSANDADPVLGPDLAGAFA